MATKRPATRKAAGRKSPRKKPAVSAPVVDTRPKRARPSKDDYYMKMALAVRERANCLGNRVGAIIVVKDRVVSTGYNGVPEKVKNCEQGGCYRCSHRDEFESGTGYDLCICVHAEQNALLTAARHGISVEGGTLYTAMRPCFGCTKELLQADVKRVYYRWDWEHPNPDVQHQYELIQAKMTIEPLDVEDPDADWALSKRPPEPEETGHSLPD